MFLALFLHDIAKGRLEDHSSAGVAVARTLCPRLGLTEAETETVAWLVENHLVMSDTAQRRDLGDSKTIATFASLVQTLERLKMLFVLTVCDIRAVGPGVWNNWKAELLRTLYWETEVVLAGGHSAIDRKERVAKARAQLRQALPEWSSLDFDAYAARLPQAYWLKATLEQKLLHAKHSEHDGGGGNSADDPYPHRSRAGRHRTHDHRPRPCPAVVDYRRRLRRDRSQYRRRAGVHDRRRHGARHHLRVAGFPL